MNLSLRYRRNSFCGDAFDEEIDEVRDDLLEAGMQIDDRYFEHMREHNGGVPVASWRDV